MSKARELLWTCLEEMQNYEVPCPELMIEVKELLAQPEQERVKPDWVSYRNWNCGMKETEVFIEQIPEHFKSQLSITITCKKSESWEAQAIVDYLSSVVNVRFRRVSDD